jgi:hypothetical protein
VAKAADGSVGPLTWDRYTGFFDHLFGVETAKVVT